MNVKRIFSNLVGGIVGMMLVAIVMIGNEFGFFTLNVRHLEWFFIVFFSLGAIVGDMYFQNYQVEIDIHSRGVWPANCLSNFYPCPFYFDGIFCASRESLLQAFKTRFVNKQVKFCGLSGRKAQKAGQEYNDWKKDQCLYWNGKSYKRDSQEYQDLLKRVFDIENMSVDIIVALLATENKKLVHSIGKSDPVDTILTEQEFCQLMTDAREELKEKGLAYIG